MKSLIVTFLICVLIIVVIFFMIWQISGVPMEEITAKIKKMVKKTIRALDDVEEKHEKADSAQKKESTDKKESADKKVREYKETTKQAKKTVDTETSTSEKTRVIKEEENEEEKFSDIVVKTAEKRNKYIMDIVIDGTPYKTADVDYYPYSIGRGRKNDCIIDYPYISSVQAVLKEEKGKIFYIVDDNAANPSKKDGEVIEKTEVRDGVSILAEGKKVEIVFKKKRGSGDTLMYDTEKIV